MTIFSNFYQLNEEVNKFEDLSQEYFIKSFSYKYGSEEQTVMRLISKVHQKKALAYLMKADRELKRICNYLKTNLI
jgi:hypothetical protein